MLCQLWAGKPAQRDGAHYQARGMVLTRTDVPLWVGGFWPRRPPVSAAHLTDGVFPNLRDHDSPLGFRPPTLDEVAHIRQQFIAFGGRTDADLVLMSIGAPPDIDIAAYRTAGVTWWLETAWGISFDSFRRKLREGPPT